MVLPTTYPAVLFALVLAMLCWGSWANTQKMTGKWRFELFYYDFAFGILLSAVIAAFTLGTLNSRELTFQDNFLIASYHNMAYAAGAGVVFNLGNMFLVGALSVSGMAVALPLSWGVTMVVAAAWGYGSGARSNLAMLAAGAALLLAAVIVHAAAYSAHVHARNAAAKALQPDPRLPRSARPPGAGKGIALSLISGIFIGSSYALIDVARSGETGVAPYGITLLFAAGLFFSTLFLNPFFLNFPVHGKAVELKAYFSGSKRQHLLGVLGGAIWVVGALAYFAGITAPMGIQAGPMLTTLLLQSAALVGLLWGLLAWREFQGGSERVKVLVAGMLVLYIAGVGLMATAPLYAK